MSDRPPLYQRVLSGDPRAIARAMSLIEDDAPGAPDLVRALFPQFDRVAFRLDAGFPIARGGATPSSIQSRQASVRSFAHQMLRASSGESPPRMG